ncbi:MAG: hypothetical protein FWF59_11945 [Turicibacter sp.]|nr:hypothetical protein [Turicibacter sp.]
MCKAGDILIVENYKHGDKLIGRHSFVVINDKDGKISSLDYDMVCNVMSSFKNPQQREKKLKFRGNFEVKNGDLLTNPNNGKDGFVKTEQFYFFKKEKIDFEVIGRMNPEPFQKLLKFIEELNIPIEAIVDNL